MSSANSIACVRSAGESKSHADFFLDHASPSSWARTVGSIFAIAAAKSASKTGTHIFFGMGALPPDWKSARFDRREGWYLKTDAASANRPTELSVVTPRVKFSREHRLFVLRLSRS